MVKVIFLMKSRKDLDPDEVRRWWRNDHGALALRNMGMRRYVQNHFKGPVDEEYAQGGLEFDGCVEVWFDDLETCRRTLASPEWQALDADGPNGFDMGGDGRLRDRARHALGRRAGSTPLHRGGLTPPARRWARTSSTSVTAASSGCPARTGSTGASRRTRTTRAASRP